MKETSFQERTRYIDLFRCSSKEEYTAKGLHIYDLKDIGDYPKGTKVLLNGKVYTVLGISHRGDYWLEGDFISYPKCTSGVDFITVEDNININTATKPRNWIYRFLFGGVN